MKWVQPARKFESAFCLFFVIPKGNKKKISNFRVGQIRVNDKKKKFFRYNIGVFRSLSNIFDIWVKVFKNGSSKFLEGSL